MPATCLRSNGSPTGASELTPFFAFTYGAIDLQIAVFFTLPPSNTVFKFAFRPIAS
jgi:hypothetical protein